MQPEFDTPQWRELRDQYLLQWLKGDQHALDALVMLWDICETWDDLIDGDKPLADDTIHRAFLAALLYLPRNPFWQANRHDLEPVFLTGVNAWLDANTLEKSSVPNERLQSFYLRKLYMEVLAVAIAKVGGFAHLRAVSLEARRFFNSYETYSQWEHALPLEG